MTMKSMTERRAAFAFAEHSSRIESMPAMSPDHEALVHAAVEGEISVDQACATMRSNYLRTAAEAAGNKSTKQVA